MKAQQKKRIQGKYFPRYRVHVSDIHRKKGKEQRYQAIKKKNNKTLEGEEDNLDDTEVQDATQDPIND